MIPKNLLPGKLGDEQAATLYTWTVEWGLPMEKSYEIVTALIIAALARSAIKLLEKALKTKD